MSFLLVILLPFFNTVTICFLYVGALILESEIHSISVFFCEGLIDHYVMVIIVSFHGVSQSPV